MATGFEDLGVMKVVSPRVMMVMSLWVFLADGIFWAMAMDAERAALWACAVEGLGLTLALLALSAWRVLSGVASLISALIFGSLIYSFCGLVGFAVVVALQVGLMHFCAFVVVSKLINALKSRLLAPAPR